MNHNMRGSHALAPLQSSLIQETSLNLNVCRGRWAKSKIWLAMVGTVLFVSACSELTTTPIEENAIRIDVRVSRVCGDAGAARLSAYAAAVETIRAGYNRYYISDNLHHLLLRVVLLEDGAVVPPEYLVRDARTELGPKWRQIVSRPNPSTCLFVPGRAGTATADGSEARLDYFHTSPDFWEPGTAQTK